ncbi:MAG: hypothetical protein JSU90_02745 [Nitrospiraceae bacterium]|nr:MAG: hypothetical protein JSU90_02745 [Nitrospiraceae bacterium]
MIDTGCVMEMVHAALQIVIIIISSLGAVVVAWGRICSSDWRFLSPQT